MYVYIYIYLYADDECLFKHPNYKFVSKVYYIKVDNTDTIQ